MMKWLHRVAQASVTLLIVVAIANLLVGVFLRYFVGAITDYLDLDPVPYVWVEEVGEMALAWLTLLGAAIAIDSALDSYEQLNFSKALETIWGFIGTLDKFIVERAPWKLGKSAEAADRELLRTSLATMAEALRLAVALLQSVMPATAGRINEVLGHVPGAVWRDELAWGGRLAGKRVAVERNGTIVPRSLHAQTALADGDRLEIVVAVGGG